MFRHFAICTQFESVIKKIKEGTYNKSVVDDRDVQSFTDTLLLSYYSY